MSTASTVDSTAEEDSDDGSALSDALVVTWRNLKRIPRIPELAIFAILQSVMFVLLFAFVFGGAIPLPGGGSYREFLCRASLLRPSPSRQRQRQSAWSTTWPRA